MTDGGRCRAVIFDMDGVLTDSEPAFHAAANDILARYGKHISLQEYRQFIGVETPQMWRRLIALRDVPITVEEAVREYEAPLMARLREPRPPLPHARALLDELRRRRVPLALCSSSYRRWVDVILASAGLAPDFDAIVTGDMVARTKPDPEPYARAASMLGVAPDACLALEDSASGVRSASAAGCRVVQVRATATAAEAQPEASLVITSLAEFPFGLLRD